MSTTPQGTAADWLVSAFKKNPEGLLLIAAGAVLMMRRGGGEPKTVESTNRMADAAAGAREYAADLADRTTRQAQAVISNASDQASQTTQKISEQSDRVIHQVQSTMQSALNRVLQDQPLLVAVAGLAAGAAIASAFPATELEKETLGPIGDQVTDVAAQVGERLKDATAAAGETLKKAADDRGLNTDGLKQVATEVAESFKENMAGAGQNAQTKPHNVD